MKRLSSDRLCVSILLQMFYPFGKSGWVPLDVRYGGYLDIPSKEFESYGAESLGLWDEESLNNIIDDSDNNGSNQELTSESMSFENIDKKSRAGRCSI